MFLPSHRFSHGGKFVALASDVAPTSRLQTVEDVTLLTSVAVIKCVTKNSAVVTKFDHTHVYFVVMKLSEMQHRTLVALVFIVGVGSGQRRGLKRFDRGGWPAQVDFSSICNSRCLFHMQ